MCSIASPTKSTPYGRFGRGENIDDGLGTSKGNSNIAMVYSSQRYVLP